LSARATERMLTDMNFAPPSAPITPPQTRSIGSTVGRLFATIVVLVGAGIAALISVVLGMLSSLNCIETCSEGMVNQHSPGPAIGVIVGIAIGIGAIWASTKIWSRD
jgi:hypothetical protein